MDALKPYIKISAPGYADLLRKFGPGEEDADQLLRRLVLTLDLTLTDMTKPPEYRAKQANIFLSFNNDQIATMFSYARVISCDAMPRVDKATGKFANNIGVWVREEDAQSAAALMSKQRWVASIEQDRTHLVPAVADHEPLNLSDAPRRRTQAGVHLSL